VQKKLRAQGREQKKGKRKSATRLIPADYNLRGKKIQSKVDAKENGLRRGKTEIGGEKTKKKKRQRRGGDNVLRQENLGVRLYSRSATGKD